jgi:hypothetical protein
MIWYNSGNSMVHKALFTLAIHHNTWAPDTWLNETNLECQALRDGTPFNPSTLQMLDPQAAILDLLPNEYVNCTSIEASFASLAYLPPGNLTIKAVGSAADATAVVDAPMAFVTIPRSPLLLLHINASRCRQNTTAGKLPFQHCVSSQVG